MLFANVSLSQVSNEARRDCFDDQKKPGQRIKACSDILPHAKVDFGRALILYHRGRAYFTKRDYTRAERDYGDAIKLTTARYYTPSGNSIQAKGIKPDIELQSLSISRSKSEEGLRVNESQLSGHLKNTEDSKAEKEASPKSQGSLAESDYHLFEALNLLKSLVIINSRMSK